MSGYTPTLTFETDFDGDHVVFKVKRIQRALFRKIMPLLPTVEEGDEEKDIEVKMTHQQSIDMLEICIDDLPDYVESMEGLKDSSGNKLEFKQIVNETYFQVLLMELVSFMMQNARPGKEEGKNSDAPHDTTSVDSALAVQSN